jgi:hypothetical protein
MSFRPCPTIDELFEMKADLMNTLNSARGATHKLQLTSFSSRKRLLV